MKKKIAILSLLLIIATLFAGIGCYQTYLKTAKMNRSTIWLLLSGVLDYDVDKRLKDSGEPYSYSNVLPGEKIKPGFISIQAGDSISYIEKTPEHEAKTLPVRNDQALQSVLLMSGYPLNVHTIDSLLTAELHKKEIQIDLGVRYINKQTKEVQDSKPGDPVYHAFSTDSILLGLGGEMEVQAFYKIPLISIVRQESISFILFILFWLFITTIILFQLFKKTTRKVTDLPLSNTKETPGPNSMMQICESLYYDSAKAIIHYAANQTVTLTEQQATLFFAFLTAPEQYLKNKEIEDLFWENQDNKRGSRLQAIQRLRKALSPITELQIESINQKGYQLQITKG